MKHKILPSIALSLVMIFSLTANVSIAASDNECGSTAEPAYFQLALYNPIQLVDECRGIKGFRLNFFYGKNTDVSGIDLALGVNNSVNFSGIQIGTMNSTGVQLIPFQPPLLLPASSANGIQIALLMNTSNSFSGIQIGAANLDYGESGLVGVQTAFVLNGAVGRIKGIQLGAINFAGIGNRPIEFRNGFPNDAGIKGMQIGILNAAYFVTGIQIGLVNYCKDIKGIQIGLINYIDQGRVPFLPIINAKF